jgi:hypothetical protein
VRTTVVQVLTANGMADKRAQDLATALASGRWTHDYPISFEEAKALGLPVFDAIPKEACAHTRPSTLGGVRLRASRSCVQVVRRAMPSNRHKALQEPFIPSMIVYLIL